MDRTAHFNGEEGLAGGIRSVPFDSSGRRSCQLFGCCESLRLRLRRRLRQAPHSVPSSSSALELLVAPLASLLPLAFLLVLTPLLPLTLLWAALRLLLVSLTLPLTLRSILLALRLWCLLLMLDYRWLWLLLLTLDCRASLLRRDRGGG